MATALSKVRDQIERAILADRPYLAKTQRLQRGLARKLQRLVSTDVSRRLAHPWTRDAETFANYYLDDEAVRLLLLPTADLRFFLARLAGMTAHDVVYAAADGEGVECYRDATTFLINVDGEDGATHSWSRCVSVSKLAGDNAYRKHLHAPNYNGDVAKYAAAIVPRNIETLVVRHGVGHFDGANRLFMYAAFDFVVGMTGRRAARSETSILKVQLDKARRPAFMRRLKSGARRPHQDGWEVRMHGYPISRAELRQDFPVGVAQVLAGVIRA